MYFLVSLFWILSIAGLFVLVFNKKVEIVLPLVFIIPAFFLYPFGFVSQLHLGYYLTWVFVLAFYVLLFIKARKDKQNLIKFIDNYFSIGLFIFVLLYFYVYIAFSGSGFNFYDEFLHWGPMVREMVKNNTYYSIQEAILGTHKDYPPFYQLVQYIFCCHRSYIYYENRLFIANITFMFSMFMPLFSFLNRKRIKDFLLAAIIGISVVFVGLAITTTPFASDLAHVYNSVYIDWALAVLTAYTLYSVLQEEDTFYYVNILFCFSALLLMKQMGLPFTLLGILLMVIKLVFVEKKKHWVPVVLTVTIPFLLFYSWRTYIAGVGAIENAQFTLSQIKIEEVAGIIKGTSGETWQHVAYNNFFKALVERKLLMKPYPINYMLSVALLCIILLFSTKSKIEGFMVSGVYLFGACAYVFAMMLLYMFSFGSYEGPTLASFDRYMLTYIYIGICFVFMMMYKKMLIHDKKYLYCILFVSSLCLFTDFSNINDLKIHHIEDNMASNKNFKIFADLYDAIEDKRVIIVEQFVTDTFTDCLLSYGGYFDSGVRLVRIGDRGWDANYTIYPTVKEWINILHDYAYLYIACADEYFINEYWVKTTNKPLINEGFYKIVFDNNDGVDFQCINYD